VSDRVKALNRLFAVRKEMDAEKEAGVPTTPHDSPPLTTTRPEPPPVTTTPRRQKGVAPERDFNRRANSLERDAMPAGLFPGTTFKVYNAIYLRTLGAINPTRKVRASRRDFLDWTDIRNLKTVDGHLRYLTTKGLLIRRWELGSTEGSEYEIVLPEELPRFTTTTHQSPPAAMSQETGSDYSRESGSGGESQPSDFKEQPDSLKTYTKTTTTDDDELRPLRELERELNVRPGDWNPALQLLADEIRRARANTPAVSDAAKFAAAHLTRLFAPKSRPARLQAQTEASPKPPEEIEPPDPETLAEFEKNRAELKAD
jgi:hypothetical protein